MDDVNVWLKAPLAPYNHIYGKNGRLYADSKTSFYRETTDIDKLTFDSGNQKVLANITAAGGIKQLTFYRENHLTEEKPGVWVNKNLAQTNNVDFAVIVDGEWTNLTKNDHDFVIDTIADSVPRIQHRLSNVQITEVPFCPIAGDKRDSMLVVGFWVTNRSQSSISVDLPVPKLYQKKYSDQQNVLLTGVGSTHLKLAPGERGSVGIALIDPDCVYELSRINQLNLDRTLIATVEYFMSKFGGLNLDNKEMTVIFRRSIYQSLLSLAMDSKDNIVGSNWGSYPATNRIWNKDMYYAALPTLFLDGYLCRRVIRWFTRYGVKPEGTKFHGGLEHSVGNALAAGMLAGMYYQWTGDRDFFVRNVDIVDTAVKIIDELERRRPDKKNHLCHSEWVSDAYALGDYHTGSNICLWLAATGMSRICQIMGRNGDAKRLQKLSEDVRADINHLLVIADGPFGRQWLEGRDRNGQYEAVKISKYRHDIYDQGLVFLEYMIKNEQINLLMHDGEESDTTLAPVYGFVSLTSPVYQHTMRFAGSEGNPTYVPNIKGISWGMESGATFPGFISVLMGHTASSIDFETFFIELTKLADLDGSWWWWPYPVKPSYGHVVRNFGCGKCGWASGMISVILITQYMGLRVDAGRLIIQPMANLSKYSWMNARLGNRHFDVALTKQHVRVRNLGDRPLTIIFSGQCRNVCAKGSCCFERSK